VVPEQYQVIRLGSEAEGRVVASFVSAVEKIRYTVDVLSLVLGGLDALHSEPINEGCDDPEVMGTPPGRRYVATLSGGFQTGEEQPGLEFRVWVKFTWFSAYQNSPVKLRLDELYVGIVPLDGSAAEVLDISREHLPGSRLRIPGFQWEWQQLVAARAMAVALAE